MVLTKKTEDFRYKISPGASNLELNMPAYTAEVPKPRVSQPEIIPPRPRKKGLSDEQLDQLAGILDDFIKIPGVPVRIGLDAIIGLIPGFGDVITGVASFAIVFSAWQRGLPRITLTRMVFNIAFDTLLGAVPFFGDAFDVFWKSNRMNYRLLMRHRQQPLKHHAWRDWAFLFLLAFSVALIVVVPIAILIWLIHVLRTHGALN